ncbi:MAG: LamG domain-containing protein, partial [Cyclobacteriaceae bacterium]
MIDFILRDPPGSQSYARLAEKSKITKIRSSTVKNGVERNIQFRAGVMIAVNTTAGAIEVSNQVFKNTIGVQNKEQKYRSAEQVAKISFETDKSVQTSAENKNTGAGSDIFVGNAMNIFFSPSHNIDLIPSTHCGVDGNECYPLSFMIDGESYSVARQRSISFGLEELPTLFQYTQRQLEQLILEMENDLQSVIDPADRARIKNQIRIWKSAIAENEYQKLMAKHALDEGTGDILTDNISFADGSSVRRDYTLGVENELKEGQEFNWYIGGLLNLEILLGPVYLKFDMEIGSANYVTVSDQSVSSDSKTLTLQMTDNDPGDRYSVDVVIENPGYKNDADSKRAELTALYDEYRTEGENGLLPSSGDISDVDNTFEYRPDEIKFLNPIFITKGGRTSCPYEPQEHARYLEYLRPENLEMLKENGIISKYEFDANTSTSEITYLPPSPGLEVNDKIILNYGTFKRDQPGMRIEPRIKRDVPWDTRAQFDIILENNNVEDTVRTYKLFVDQRTTGAGPTMRLDGERFIKGTPIPLNAGESLRKIFTMRPIRDVYEYEDIVIYLAAGCQFDFGQDLDFQEDIFARDTISAYFDPVCPMATEIIPTQGWSINNNTGSKLLLEIQEQEFYFENHSKVILQYKAAYQSDEDWVDIALWSKDQVEVDQLVASGENAYLFDTENNYIVYEWETADYPTPDGDYMVRWKYFCENGLESLSAPITGKIDRTSPHAFGRPQPADGILSPSDEIVLTLNEPIEEGLVDRDLIRVSGKVNGSPLTHPVSIRFDGDEEVTIPNIHWNQEAITVEMWLRKQISTGREEVIFQHSESNKSDLRFSLLADGRLSLQLNSQTLVTDDPVSLDAWSHVAFSIDPTAKKAAIYHNATLAGFSESFFATHSASGTIMLGNGFTGNLHELRVWKRYMSATDIAPNFYNDLTGREIGLVGYWPFKKGKGGIAEERVQGKNAILNAQWWLEPASISYHFSDNPIQLPGEAFEKEEDFTIEFWIKPEASNQDQYLISNGGPKASGWSLYLNSTGQLQLDHNDQHLVLIDSVLTDNRWHHVAMVVNRIGKTVTYLNGNVHNSHDNDLFGEFGGPGIYLGTHAVPDQLGNLVFTSGYSGLMDEFRIWQTARGAEQIGRYAAYKLDGTEFGLVKYLPFERYDNFLRITKGDLILLNEEGKEATGHSTAEK